MIDYGNYSTNKHDYQIKTFRPALHVYEYMEKIITECGYTFESKFFDSDFFRRLIIPNNESIFLSNTSKLFKSTFDPNINYDYNSSNVNQKLITPLLENKNQEDVLLNPYSAPLKNTNYFLAS